MVSFLFLSQDHNVVVVSEEGKLMRKIGSDHVTCFPNGIDISDAGDVLIGDSHGNKFHVAVYDKTANCVSQFECPHVKVGKGIGIFTLNNVKIGQRGETAPFINP